MDYGVLAVAVCVYVYTVICVSCSCYLYYIAKNMYMMVMGMVFEKKWVLCAMSAMFAPFSPPPGREQTHTHTAIYAYTRTHTCTCSPPAAGGGRL